jgi:hypothetical protein
MGFLILLLILGVGAAALYAESAKKAGTFPKPAAMIGTSYLQAFTQNRRVLVTRHGQGFAWYLQDREGDILDQGNESALAEAVRLGLESLLSRTSGDASVNFLVDHPAVTAFVARVSASQWSYNLVDTSAGTVDKGKVPTRIDAINRALEFIFAAIERRDVPVPTPDDPLEGTPGTPVGLWEYRSGIEMNADKTQFKVHDLEPWKRAAAPHVVAAWDEGITDARELTNAVFGVELDANIDNLTIDDVPWHYLETRIQQLMDTIADGRYLAVAAPDRRVAGAVVGRFEDEEGDAGVFQEATWVVQRPKAGGSGGLGSDPNPDQWQWLAWDGPRGLDRDADARGMITGTLAEARTAAQNRIAHGL